MLDISSLYSVGSGLIQQASSASTAADTEKPGFGTVLQSAMDMIKETNQFKNVAETEEMNFAMGYSDNTHDLAVAQQKANVSLQYTVAVRDRLLDAYKEIMNIQI